MHNSWAFCSVWSQTYRFFRLGAAAPAMPGGALGAAAEALPPGEACRTACGTDDACRTLCECPSFGAGDVVDRVTASHTPQVVATCAASVRCKRTVTHPQDQTRPAPHCPHCARTSSIRLQLGFRGDEWAEGAHDRRRFWRPRRRVLALSPWTKRDEQCGQKRRRTPSESTARPADCGPTTVVAVAVCGGRGRTDAAASRHTAQAHASHAEGQVS